MRTPEKRPTLVAPPDRTEEPGTPSAQRRQERRRRDRMRQAIRSVLAGVSLALVAAVGVASAEVAQYTVQPGDSLNSVAERIGARASDIAALNDIANGDLLAVGQVLKLPSGAELRAAPSARGSARPSFTWPVRGIITTDFREPGPYWSSGYHPGLDVAAPNGTRVVAAGDGVVIEAEADGWNSGYGHYVKIDHGDGVFALYGHLSTVSVSAGERVAAGTPIGRIGMTGFTTGPHLHWEVRLGSGVLGAPTADPQAYLR